MSENEREAPGHGLESGTAAPAQEAGQSAQPSMVGAVPAAALQRRIQRRLAQRKANGDISSETVHAAAEAGTQGASRSLPHLDQIQKSFGHHDVSGIQAHTDDRASAASTQMGAEAYASGNHVAFAGAPSLHTAAHEAAHVVQQQGGVQLSGGVGVEGDAHEQHADAVADAVVRGESAQGLLDQYQGGAGVGGVGVQRKVGLEFETGVPVREGDGSKLEYQQPVWGGNSDPWKIEADSSKLEFVTKPFEQDGSGRSALENEMDDITGWVTALIGKAGSAKDHTVPIKDMGNKAANGTIKAGPVDNVTASPQATGGVPLDKIPDLMTKAGSTKLDHLKDNHKGENKGKEVDSKDQNLMGMNSVDGAVLAEAASRAKGATDKIKNEMSLKKTTIPAHGFKKLEGLMALVISYIMKGQAQKAVWSYSKLIAPLMSRVDFSSMYKALEKDEQGHFTKDLVLEAAGGVSSSANMYAKGFGDDPSKLDHGPTCGAWIDSIVHGSKVFDSDTGKTTDHEADLMSAGLTNGSTAMGAVHGLDKNAKGKTELAVLELRRLPKGQYYTMWKHTALAVFDFFDSLQGKE